MSAGMVNEIVASVGDIKGWLEGSGVNQELVVRDAFVVQRKIAELNGKPVSVSDVRPRRVATAGKRVRAEGE
jgi:hypothetical protein